METLSLSSRSPIGVIVIAVFLCLLGLLSLGRLPLQLFPDVKKPELSVQAGWRTASPEEVESALAGLGDDLYLLEFAGATQEARGGRVGAA